MQRRRGSPAVRLEVERQHAGAHPGAADERARPLGDEDVHALPGPLDLSGLWDLHKIDRPDLKDRALHPVTQPDLAQLDEDIGIFELISDRDMLVHHPYESFTTSVERFVEQAAADPDVLAIKQTLYRTAGRPIVSALIEAAQRGKQVVVLVELKARFDETANITWARTLEQAGCHVVYGLSGLKTHCKLCLVVRREGDRLKRYVHVGTGNYNPITARLYEDMGLLTADAEIGARSATSSTTSPAISRKRQYQSLMVAPSEMRDRIIEMIEREAALSTPERPGHIMMKLNALTDEPVIDALYDASEKGVRIDLLVRGICSSAAGRQEAEQGKIRVRSILGRFLEHSRIFYFQNGSDERVLHRQRRHDAAQPRPARRGRWCQVKSPELKQQLKLLLDLGLRRQLLGVDARSPGEWHKDAPKEGEVPLDYQEQLMRHPTADA